MTTQEVALRRGWYHGWNVVAACVIATFLSNGMAINAFSLFLSDWSKDLDTPISTFQLALAPLGILSGACGALAGILADKYPARWLFGVGLAAMVLFQLGISLVTEVWQLQLLYAVVLPPALALCATVPANALVSRWFVRRVGLALGLTAFGVPGAGVILPPLIAAIMPGLGWRTTWQLGALVTVILLPLVLWVMRDRPDDRDGAYYLTSDGSAPPPSHHGGGRGDRGIRWRDVFKRRNFWILVVGYLPMVALYGGIQQNLAPIAAGQEIGQQTAGLLLAAFSLAQVAATITMGILSDRFGNRPPLVGLAFSSALGAVVVAFSHDATTLTAGVLLTGFAGGVWTLVGAVIAVEFGAAAMGRAFGLAGFFVSLIVLTPFVVAKVQESTGSYTPALLGCAALAVFGGVVSMFLRERPRGQAAEAAAVPGARSFPPD